MTLDVRKNGVLVVLPLHNKSTKCQIFFPSPLALGVHEKARHSPSVSMYALPPPIIFNYLTILAIEVKERQ